MFHWLANFTLLQIIEFCAGLLLFLSASLSPRLPATKHWRLLLWAQFTFLIAGMCLILMSLLRNEMKPLGWGLLEVLTVIAVSVMLAAWFHARDKRRRASLPSPPAGTIWPPPPSEWECIDESMEED